MLKNENNGWKEVFRWSGSWFSMGENVSNALSVNFGRAGEVVREEDEKVLSIEEAEELANALNAWIRKRAKPITRDSGNLYAPGTK